MILITGVNGFIGKHLFNFYKNIKGEKVLGFDKNFHLSFLDENIEDLEFFDFVKDGRAEFIERFLSKLEGIKDKHLKIYHLASEVGVNFHDKTTFKSQMILNSNIYEILLELKHQGFKIDLAYASSSEVYGEVDDIDDIQCGQTRLLAIDRKPIFDKPERNEYILQKLFAEKLFDNLGLNSFSIQRFFNVFGYGQDSKKGFNAIVLDRIYNENNVSSEPLIINKNSSRTYTLIDEAVVKMVDDFESNIGAEYTSVENIYGKYTVNSLDLIKCHLFVADFILKNNFKGKEYNSIMGTLLLKKIDENDYIFSNILELDYVVNDNLDEIQNRSLFSELIFTKVIPEQSKTFLLELLKYHLLYLYKNYDKDILLHEDSKLEYLGTLIKEDDELFNDLITELDVNSNFRNLVNKIPYYELRKETIEEKISL
jgi:nucleoside-diphosphate-sugar epimerase